MEAEVPPVEQAEPPGATPLAAIQEVIIEEAPSAAPVEEQVFEEMQLPIEQAPIELVDDQWAEMQSQAEQVTNDAVETLEKDHITEEILNKLHHSIYQILQAKKEQELKRLEDE